MPNFDQRHQKVFQQLNADTINIVLSNFAEARTRQWRPLLQVRYGVLEDSQLSRGRFCDDVFLALNDAFQNVGYRKFTTLMSVANTKGSDGTDYIVYSLVGHQISFLDALRKRGIDRVKNMFAIARAAGHLEGEPKAKAVEKLNQEWFTGLSKPKNWEQWKRLTHIGFVPDISAIQIEYDPITCQVIMSSFEEHLLDPAEYPDHLATTSEILRWIGSFYRRPMGYLGNVGWINDSPRMLKLIAYILDHGRVDFHSIRIDANDYEQWDFSYPDLEEEMIAYGSQTDVPKA